MSASSISSQRSLLLQPSTEPIIYNLKRSNKRRTLSVSISHSGDVCVHAPVWLNENKIEDFLKTRRGWIKKHLDDIKSKKKSSFLGEGVNVLFLGQEYPLQLTITTEGQAEILFMEDAFKVKVSSHIEERDRERVVKDVLIDWYLKEAKRILRERTLIYSQRLDVKPLRVTLRQQKGLWGSCNYMKKSISLNWQIILAPLAVTDYVVVHELCHLLFPNHSKYFWQKVESIVPDYDTHRKWLNHNRHRLHLDL